MSLVARRVKFTYTPYEPERAVFVSYALPPTMCSAATPLPPNTIYAELRGYVSFIPYPTDADSASQDIRNAAAVKPPSFEDFVAATASGTTPSPVPAAVAASTTDPFMVTPATLYDETETADVRLPSSEPQKSMTPPPQQQLSRVFIGQLPYHVTEMQLVWICAAFGGRVMSPQRIMKANARGERLPTGGVHVLCDEANFLEMEQCMHKRVLVDDTGLWFAATLQEKSALDSFISYLHNNRGARRAGRPYDTVVVQRALSSFVPRRNMHFDGQR